MPLIDMFPLTWKAFWIWKKNLLSAEISSTVQVTPLTLPLDFSEGVVNLTETRPAGCRFGFEAVYSSSWWSCSSRALVRRCRAGTSSTSQLPSGVSISHFECDTEKNKKHRNVTTQLAFQKESVLCLMSAGHGLFYRCGSCSTCSSDADATAYGWNASGLKSPVTSLCIIV